MIGKLVCLMALGR